MSASLAMDRWIALSPLSDAQSERDALARLVERLRARDSALYEAVLRELLPHVRGWLFHLLGPHPELDDAVQESLAEIAGALHRFEGRSSLGAMARRIAVRTGSRYFRRRAPWHRARWSLDSESDARTPEATLADRELLVRMYEHLETLSPKQRAAFVLCVVEGLSPTEAAEAVGCSPVAMRSRLFEARAALSERLRRDPDLRALWERSTWNA